MRESHSLTYPGELNSRFTGRSKSSSVPCGAATTTLLRRWWSSPPRFFRSSRSWLLTLREPLRYLLGNGAVRHRCCCFSLSCRFRTSRLRRSLPILGVVCSRLLDLDERQEHDICGLGDGDSVLKPIMVLMVVMGDDPLAFSQILRFVWESYQFYQP